MTSFFIMYGAGSLGAIAHSLVGWLFTSAGVFAMFGSTYGMPIGVHSLYPRMVWEGGWALFYLLPGLSRLNTLQSSFLLALIPSAMQWLYWFPRAGNGWFGVERGLATPFFVFLLYFIWALVTVFFGSSRLRR